MTSSIHATLIFGSLTVYFMANAQQIISGPEFDVDFVEQSFFVDKTELLHEFLRSRYGPDYNYVSYPSKFGKTLVLRMIQRFCRVELNDEHVALNWTLTKSYKLFENLKISKYPDTLRFHLTRHPVLLLDFNFTMESPITRPKLVTALIQQVQKCYLEYQWLIESSKKSANHFYDEVMEKALRGTLDIPELETSILLLSRLLREHFKIGVILLVDNYDLMTNSLFLSEHPDRVFFQNLTSSLLKASLVSFDYSVSHAFIAGVSQLTYNLDQTITKDASSITNGRFLSDDRFGAYFGFTQPEMIEMCTQHRCTSNEKWLLAELYDGFTNPSMFKSDMRRIYNPYSVREFFTNRNTPVPFRNYWIRSQDTNFIYRFLQESYFRKLFVELFKYDSIKMTPREDISKSNNPYEDLLISFEPYNNSLLLYLFDSGYLTYLEKHNDRVTLPNADIKQFLASLLAQFYKEIKCPIDDLRRSLLKLLVNGTSSEATEILHHLRSTLHLITTQFGYQSPANVSSHQNTVQPEIIRLEAHNVIMAAALDTHTAGTEVAVLRMMIKSPERDHILISVQNRTMIIRMDKKLLPKYELPPALQKALVSATNQSSITINVLDLKIDDAIETDIAYKDFSSMT